MKGTKVKYYKIQARITISQAQNLRVDLPNLMFSIFVLLSQFAKKSSIKCKIKR